MLAKTLLSAALLSSAPLFAADDNDKPAAPDKPQQPLISVSVVANDGEPVVVEGNGTVEIRTDTRGDAPGQTGIHVIQLQNAFDQLPEDNPARKHLEQHLLTLLNGGRNGGQTETRVTSFATSSAESVISDQEHRIKISVKDGHKTVVVEDLAGKELFAGPWNTEADKAKAPAAIRKKLDDHQAAVQITTEVHDGVKTPARPAAKTPKNGKQTDVEQQHRQPLRDADGRRVF